MRGHTRAHERAVLRGCENGRGNIGRKAGGEEKRRRGRREDGREGEVGGVGRRRGGRRGVTGKWRVGGRRGGGTGKCL